MHKINIWVRIENCGRILWCWCFHQQQQRVCTQAPMCECEIWMGVELKDWKKRERNRKPNVSQRCFMAGHALQTFDIHRKPLLALWLAAGLLQRHRGLFLKQSDRLSCSKRASATKGWSRERERGKREGVCVCVHVFVHVYPCAGAGEQ